MSRGTQLRIVAPSATPEEAAAIVAAVEQFARDTAPPAPPRPGASPWARAALLEGTGHASSDHVGWLTPG
jgi:hypothetical protein